MTFIAVDIGASSGRVIQFKFTNNRLSMNEVHRFKNKMVELDSSHYWDIDYLVENVFAGLSQCDESISIGIDTWAVDYVCLNSDNTILKPYAYRDKRTHNLVSCLDRETLFYKTGLGYLPFNTIYQLEASNSLKGQFMMIPDYIAYCLSGVVSCEFTNAVTTQLIDITTRDFDKQLIDAVGQTDLVFKKPTQLQLWPISDDAYEKIGFNTKIAQVATHDTASAFLGSVDLNNNIVISLGTWSIVGCVVDSPITSKKAYDMNFSNEASLLGKYRFQKNTMGTWMFENLRNELNDTQTYDTLIQDLYTTDYPYIIDVDDAVFMNPFSMKEAIDMYLQSMSIPIPTTNSEYYKLVFDSMIEKYVNLIEQLNQMIPNKKSFVNIVGGGSQNSYLCEKLAQRIATRVIAGPVEATAYGNVCAQMLATNTINNYEEFQMILRNSTTIKEYKEK